MISSVKNEYEKKEKELDKQINETEQLRSYTQKMKRQIDKAVEHKAKQLTEKNSTACRNEYLLKIKVIYGITAAALTYSIYVTILTGINSVRFSRDLLKAIYYVITIAKLPFDIAYKVSNVVYHFKYQMSCPNINILIAVILTALTFIVMMISGYSLMYWIARRGIKFYHDKAQDIQSLTMALTSLAPLVQYADRLIWMRGNLVIIQLIIHVLYLLIRFIIIKNESAEIGD